VSDEQRRPSYPAGRPAWQTGTLLASLPAPVRDELLDRCRSRTFRPGQHLLRQGDQGNHAIVLLDGLVKIRIVDTSGFNAVMALRRRGDFAARPARWKIARVLAELALEAARGRRSTSASTNSRRWSGSP
jgi:hypothetical protein